MEHVLRILDDGQVPVKAEVCALADAPDLRSCVIRTYFSLMGTMMYFLAKMSTFEVHLRTLAYVSATLDR